MADFITSVTSVSELTTWYTSTVPASIPSGDRYIAELAAGTYTLTGVTWNGKTLVSAGQLVIRAASGARINSAAPAAYKSSGVAILKHSFGAVNAFGSNIADGFAFEEVEFVSDQNGGWQFNGGSVIRRCVVVKNASGASTPVFGGNGRAINSLLVLAAGVTGGCATFNGTGAQTSNTLISFNDAAAFALSGTFQNAAWKNNVALNLSGGSADPWPSPPTSFFSGASNNATSNATQGNCPGSNAVVNVSSSNITSATSYTSMDATPTSSSVLRNAGVAASANDGVDWYNTARPGTPGIGAVEYQAPPSALTGNVTLSDFTPAGGFISTPSDLGGNVTLGDFVPGGSFDSAASLLSGNVTLGDFTPGGAFGLQPGVITTQPFKNSNEGLLPNLTIGKVAVIRVSDMVNILTLTDQATDSLGILTISNVAITPGVRYLVLACDSLATSRWGVEPYVAS